MNMLTLGVQIFDAYRGMHLMQRGDAGEAER